MNDKQLEFALVVINQIARLAKVKNLDPSEVEEVQKAAKFFRDLLLIHGFTKLEQWGWGDDEEFSEICFSRAEAFEGLLNLPGQQIMQSLGDAGERASVLTMLFTGEESDSGRDLSDHASFVLDTLVEVFRTNGK